MKRSRANKEAVSHTLQRKEQKVRNGLTPLGDVLRSLLTDPSSPFNPDDARIFKIWDGVVGPAISQNARPAWIRDGSLRVSVSGPIWLQELEFASEAIMDKLNEALGREAVQKIEFRLGNTKR